MSDFDLKSSLSKVSQYKYPCTRCNDGRYYTLKGLKSHVRYRHNPSFKKKPKKTIPNFYICKYCGKIYRKKESIGAHIILCSKNPEIQIHLNNLKRSKIGSRHSVETKRKISESVKHFRSINKVQRKIKISNSRELKFIEE